MRPPELFYLFSDVKNLRGVGEGSAEGLSRLLRRRSDDDGNSNARIKDLLFHLPNSCIDRTQSPAINQINKGQTVTLLLNIVKHEAPPPRTRIPYKIICTDKDGDIINVTFFKGGAEYLSKQFPVGGQRVVSGKASLYGSEWNIPHPDIIALPSEFAKIKTIEPVYPMTWGLTNKRITGWVAESLGKAPNLAEWLDADMVKQQGWDSWKISMQQIHHPKKIADFLADYTPRCRLAYDEVLASQLALAMIRNKSTKQIGIKIPNNNRLTEQLIDNLPFKLTNGQKQVISEINTDMQSGNRMMRMIQGDVGSGKTIVALLTALPVIEHDMQVAIMAPTEILARQHLKSIKNHLTADMDKVINTTLLTGSITGKERTETLEKIANGTAKIIIGTHALFQNAVEFHNLGMVVVDEQHRFGVNQRISLSSKGNNPHMLLMSATPIPRSLNMVMYGDLDSSYLKEKPHGRPEITTSAVPLAKTDKVIEGIKRAVAKGDKIYWICPLIEKSEDEELQKVKAAEDRYSELQKIFGSDKVGMAHGKIPSAERQQIMQNFADGKYDILVATTVVEVGVDVPDATIIVIENAERFGLSQLHQLRGRVGRSNKESSCILLYFPYSSDIAKERLSIIRTNNDGFSIAEEDLKLRGGGELLGTKQSGIPDFTFLDLYEHKDLISTARDDVKLIMHNEPELDGKRGKALRTLLYLYEYDRAIKLLDSG